MAFVAADVEKLERAIKSGVQEVRYSDGTSVRYQDLNAMIGARDRIAREVSANAGVVTKRRIKTYSTKDL